MRWSKHHVSCNKRVLSFLEAHPDSWFTVEEIADGTECRKGTVASSLNSLDYRNQVEKKKLRREKRSSKMLYRRTPATAFMQFIDSLDYQSPFAWGHE
jgi:predicted transcriptional regulator